MSDPLRTKPLTGSLRPRQQTAVAIYLMGQFRLIINNNDCTHLLTYDKVKLLLAVLALAQGRSVVRSRLADMLWPDNQDEKGRARVRHALHTLRQALATAPDVLISDATGLSLNPDHVWVDVLRIVDTTDTACLHTARETLDHYSGPFLDGLKLPHSEPLLAWQQSWMARLELELTQRRARLVEQYLNQGDTQTALNHAKLWVHQWPEDEACHRLLIRLLLLAGDRDAALTAFHHCCDVLNNRLGVMPSAETRSLLGLENQALSADSLVGATLGKEFDYHPIAVVAIALSWKPDDSAAPDSPANDENSEEALETLHTWHERLLERVQQHGAWLPHTSSTTMLAHFGYPSLSERPIRHAIALAQDLATMDVPANVCFGLAIHADLTLIDQANERSLNGLISQKVVPLAWEAGHGEILLSAAAAARMADWPVESMQRTGRHYLRLSPEPGATPVARMHGRLREFDTLIQQWTRHRPGQKPITVQITGAPGLGKSQLSRAVADYVRNIDGQVITLQCHENHHEAPLHAVHPWLCAQLELPSTLDAALWTPALREQAVHDMQVRFRLSPESAHALMDTLLNRGDTLGDNHQTAIAAALTALLGSTPEQSLLITWDDIHWNDDAGTALLQQLMATRGTALTMLICTSRSVADTDQPVVTIKLDPLDATTIAEYVVHQTRKSKLSRAARARLVSDSAGVPLYIKELLHLAALRLPAGNIPRVTDMLSAQLMRLDADTRNLAYLAALLRTFDTQTAAQVLNLDADTLATRLDTLAAMGIVRHDSPEHIVCSTTVSRSIRRLMTRRKKRLLCEKTARHLIRRHRTDTSGAASSPAAPGTGNTSPEPETWWQRVVCDALEQGSADEHADYVAHVLIHGDDVDDGAQHELSGSVGNASSVHDAPTGDAAAPYLADMAMHDTQTPATGATAVDDDGPEATLAVLWRQWTIQHNQGNLLTSLHIAQRLLQLAAAQRHDVWHGWALYALAQHDLWMGNPVASESLLLRSLTSIHRDVSPDDDTFSSHSYALAYAALGWSQALQGRYNAALQNTQYAIQLASQNNCSVSTTACKLHLLRIHYLADNFKSLQAESTAILEHMPKRLAGTAGYAIATTYALLPGALAQPTANTLQKLNAALDIVRKQTPIATDGFLCLMARCQLAMRNPDVSIQLLNEAATIGHTRQSRLRSAEIHCIRGDVWVATDQPELARQEWLKAKTIVQQYSLLAYDDWANERLESLVE